MDDEELTPLVQIAAWVEGRSLHNDDSDTCCPDYSCCRPELLAPREWREMYLAAYIAQDQRTLDRMGLYFPGRLAGKIP